jgi:hypothetical protein
MLDSCRFYSRPRRGATFKLFRVADRTSKRVTVSLLPDRENRYPVNMMLPPVQDFTKEKSVPASASGL